MNGEAALSTLLTPPGRHSIAYALWLVCHLIAGRGAFWIIQIIDGSDTSSRYIRHWKHSIVPSKKSTSGSSIRHWYLFPRWFSSVSLLSVHCLP
jgi:hypothetical protein